MICGTREENHPSKDMEQSTIGKETAPRKTAALLAISVLKATVLSKSSPLTDPVLARRAFPLCWGVWRAYHLDCDDLAPWDSPTVAAQPMSASDATASIPATASDGATAA